MSFIRLHRLSPVALAIAALASAPLQAATITVTGTADDNNVLNLAGNGTCDLREAIQAANTNATVGECVGDAAGADTIAFNIPGAGPHVINVSTVSLPDITSAVWIDGYTQPGSQPNSNAASSNADIRVALQPNTTSSTGLRFMGGTASGTVRGLRITGFDYGIVADGTSAPVNILGNFVGTDGVSPMGNAITGILVQDASNVAVGSILPADRNLIAATTGQEIAVLGGASAVTVNGNLIGTRADGATPLYAANSTGIEIANTANGITVQFNVIGAGLSGAILRQSPSNVSVADNQIGIGIGGGNHGILVDSNQTFITAITIDSNTIANWGQDGVRVQQSAPGVAVSGVRMSGNSIHGNGGMGINLADTANGLGLGVDSNDPGDVDDGPNHFQNYPVITAATTDGTTTSVEFTLNGWPSTSYHVEYFSSPTCDANGYGEGRTWLGGGDVMTDASGNLSMLAPLSATTVGHALTMTATDNFINDTSEFSACMTIGAAGAQTPPVMGNVPDQTATVGVPFSLGLSAYASATDGDLISGYAIASGTLPPGLSLNATTGAITGTPTLSGATTVTVTASDNDGTSSADTITFTVTPAAGNSTAQAIPSLSGAGLAGLSSFLALLGGRLLRRGRTA